MPLSFTRRLNRTLGVDNSGDIVDAAHINELQEALEDISLGTVPIPLAGIASALQSGGYTNGAGQITTAAITPALGAWVPTTGAVANMRSGVVNVLDYGVSATALQAALTAGAGATVHFARPAGGVYSLSTALAVPGGTTVTVAPGVTFEQATHYTPVFDALDVDDVTISGGRYVYTGSRVFSADPSMRGDGRYAYGAAVWTNGNRNTVRDIVVEGFVSGAYFSAWNGVNASTAYAKQGNRAENIAIDGVDFGLLIGGQSDFWFSGIRGRPEKESGSPNPPHVLYISNVARNRNVNGGDCEGWGDSGVQFAFQVKGLDGGTITGLSQRGCGGTLYLFDSRDVCVTRVTSSSDVGSAQGSVAIDTNCYRCSVSDLVLQLASENRAITLYGTDSRMTNVTVRPYVSAYSPNGVVVMGGTRPTLDGVSIVNTDSAEADAAHGWNGILVVSGDGAYVRPHALRNLYVGVVVSSGVTNAVVDFSGTQFLTADSGQLLSDSSGGGAHIINPRSLS